MMDRTSTAIQAAPPTPRTGRAAGGLSVAAWVYLATSSAMVLGLLAYRVRLTGKNGHVSLAWDLFLAWLPLPAAWAFQRLLAARGGRGRWRRRLLAVATFAGWLLFFPNSPYLITELIHVHPAYGPSGGRAPAWLGFLVGDGPFRPSSVWLELLLLTAVAWTGAMLTFASVRLVHGAARPRLGRPLAAAAVVALLLVGSFGVAFGRFDRFNSWDVFRKPGRVADHLTRYADDPAAHPATLGWTLGLASLLAVGYFGIGEMGRGPRGIQPRMHTDGHG